MKVNLEFDMDKPEDNKEYLLIMKSDYMFEQLKEILVQINTAQPSGKIVDNIYKIVQEYEK